ncbi:MAG: N-acetyl-gamma-glutamyl-phosphate reductase [Bdellovibrionales bacterium]|nr:N-acetyl-gamma-glutamyl-phosphate reductase [Bdellovibrionales bacterium]
MVRVGLVGGSGYTGGEMLRLLLQHPEFDLAFATSSRFERKPFAVAHPNLRGLTTEKFRAHDDLEHVDCLVLALPHGESQRRLDEFLQIAPVVVDLASDFRLSSPALYEQFYGENHSCSDQLGSFVYGMPELYREELKNADRIAGCGCIATCSILSLAPLFRFGAVRSRQAFIDAKVGSSAGGATGNPSSHHPERAGCLRSFKLTAHRHTAELIEQLNPGDCEVFLSATAVDSVRGILITGQVMVDPALTELEIRQMYREMYQGEPFVRIVKERSGIYRYPEPKILSGTNFVDIGFERDPSNGRLVVVGAIDNLVKGSAGHALHSMNIRFGFPERLGLEFAGLHPC